MKDHDFIGFSVQTISSYAYQILTALAFLEKRNIIHCDLKPENILICDEEGKNLKVVDFGSGCQTDQQVYTYVQSRFYRSPEVILRVPYTPKVDLWSLGCILAELYTGEPLFPGDNEQEQLEYQMELKGIPSNSLID
jgi:dual specificity tyrosine-phosphorylation-regulated kinase 2/3/4